MNTNNDERHLVWRQAWVATGLVALVFSLVTAVLLAVGAWQTRQEATIRDPGLATLLQQARGSSEAAELAREMDRLARRAWFGGRQFQNRGMLLLTLGLLASLVCFHLAVRHAAVIADPRRIGQPDVLAESRRMRGGILAAAAALLGSALLLPLAAPEHRRQPSAPAAPPASAQVVAPTTAAGAAEWPGFRGPAGLGVCAWTNVPAAWDVPAGRNVRWRVPVGPGFSSPILAGGRAIVSTGDGTGRGVAAFALEDGRTLWQREVPYRGTTPLPEVTADTGYAAPTPASDGQRVFALFATGDLAAFTLAGEPLWQQHLGPEPIDYGHASSLLVSEGRLFVQWDHKESGRVLALDPATGTTLWSLPRLCGASWSSPVLVPVTGGGNQLVLHAPQLTSGHRMVDGAELWSVEAVTGEVAPSPAWDGGRLFLAQEYSRMVAFELGADAATEVWSYEENLPDVASPVAAHGRVWMATSGGTLTCMDGGDGHVLWSHDFADGIQASPIVAGSRLYVLERSGLMHVLDADSNAFHELAACPLGEEAVATPAFADGTVVIRGAKNLTCIQ